MSEQKHYAIIKSGGKQYRVEAGDVIDVELLGQEEGVVEFKEVLFGFNGKEAHVGSPSLDKVIVKGEIQGAVKGPKVVSYRYKQRKRIRRKVGHRQPHTRVKITEIAF